MTDADNQYVETTNLYWEMLWKAQKVEDKKLVYMIRRKLLALSVQHKSSGSVCQFISFPALPCPAPLPRETLAGFWPSQPLPAILAFIAGYCFLLASSIFANFS